MEITEEDDDGTRSKRQTVVSEVSEGESRKQHATSLSDSSTISSIKDSTVSLEPQPSIVEMESSHQSRNSSESRPQTPKSLHPNDSQKFSDSILENDLMIYGRSKVRLGPRPYRDGGMRPYTSTASPDRPISTLPAGLKSFAKKSQFEREADSKIKCDLDTRSLLVRSSSLISDSPMLRHETLNRPLSRERPNTSSGFSCRSLPSPTFTANSKTPSLDMARARLKRAQELRKKKIEFAKSLDPNALLSDPVGLTQITPPASPMTIAENEPTPTIPHDQKRPLDDVLLSLENDSHVKNGDLRGNSSEFSAVPAQLTRASSINEPAKVLTEDPHSIDCTKIEDPILSHQLLLNSHPESQSPSKSDKDNLISDDNPPPILSTEYKVSETLITRSLLPPEEEKSIPNISLTEDSVETTPEAGIGNFSDSSKKSEALIIENGMSLLETKIQESNQESESLKSLSMFGQDKIHDVSHLNSCMQYLTPSLHTPELILQVPVTIETKDVPRNYQHGLPLTNGTIKTTLTADDNSDKVVGVEFGAVTGQNNDKETQERNIVDMNVNFSNDELLDELQPAVIQEAKPVSFVKPATSSSSHFSTAITTTIIQDNDEALPKSNSLGSNPIPQDHPASSRLNFLPRSDSYRSVSSPESTLSKNSLQNLPTVKKINLGSGISQRIKALERLSTSFSEINLSPGPVSGTPAFFSVRKSYHAPKSPAKLEPPCPVLISETSSFTKSEDSSTSNLLKSKSAPEEYHNLETKIRSQGACDSTFISAPVIGDSVNYTKTQESTQEISDSNLIGHRSSSTENGLQEVEIKTNFIDRAEVELKKKTSNATQIEGEEGKPYLTVKELSNESQVSISENRRSLSLENLNKTEICPNLVGSDHDNKLNDSKFFRRSFHGREIGCNLSNPISVSSRNHFPDDIAENKNGKSSPIMHRMSMPISVNRMSTSLASSNHASLTNETRSSQKNGLSKHSQKLDIPTKIAEVNVQFPDSLLWKRKVILLDPQGYLIMAPVMSVHPHDNVIERLSVSGIRKFHMSKFKMPCAPELEAEELPNSVILDFLEGEGLQVSCHDRSTQKHILGGECFVHIRVYIINNRA